MLFPHIALSKAQIGQEWKQWHCAVVEIPAHILRCAEIFLPSLSRSGHFDFLWVRMIRFLPGKAATLDPTQKSRTPCKKTTVEKHNASSCDDRSQHLTGITKKSGSKMSCVDFYCITQTLDQIKWCCIGISAFYTFALHHTSGTTQKWASAVTGSAVDACQSCFEQDLQMSLSVTLMAHYPPICQRWVFSHVGYSGADVNAALWPCVLARLASVQDPGNSMPRPG